MIRSIIFTALWFGWHVVVLPPMVTMSYVSPAACRRVCEWAMRGFYALEKHVLKLDYALTGTEHLPQTGSYIFACKHQSTWETYKLHLWLHNPAIIMKAELMQIPLWGRVAKALGMIGVNRGAKAAAIHSLLEGGKRVAGEGRPIVIFPQGTRVAAGESKPYKAGAIALYSELGLPIIPVALNSGLFWPRHSLRKKSGVIQVKILPPIMPGLSAEAALQALQNQLETASNQLL